MAGGGLFELDEGTLSFDASPSCSCSSSSSPTPPITALAALGCLFLIPPGPTILSLLLCSTAPSFSPNSTGTNHSPSSSFNGESTFRIVKDRRICDEGMMRAEGGREMISRLEHEGESVW